jgi:hypothetical protein
MTTRFLLLLVSTAVATLAGCGSSGTSSSPTSPTGSTSTSVPPVTTTSHNAGRDCLGCHSFTVAGTVYKADGATVAPGATVRLASLPGAAEAVDLTLTADGSGNFHTSARVAFGSGLTASAAAAGGTTQTMQAVVTSGACNNCHTSGHRLRTN